MKLRTHKAIVINSKDILLLGDHVTKAATSRVLEGNARGPRTQNLINIITIIELIIETIRNLNDLRGITILNDDQMVWLKEWPPHLQKIQVSDCGYHDIELIFQSGSSSRHFWGEKMQRERVFGSRLGKRREKSGLRIWKRDIYNKRRSKNW